MADNLFAAEPLILARIREQLPDLRHVLSHAARDKDRAVTEYVPAVFLIAEDGEPESSGPQKVSEQQHWAAVIAVAYLDDADPEAVWLQQAGDIGARLIKAMHDWRHPAVLKCRYEGREPVVYAPGYIEVMLHFSTQVWLDWLQPSG